VKRWFLIKWHRYKLSYHDKKVLDAWEQVENSLSTFQEKKARDEVRKHERYKRYHFNKWVELASGKET
jgi:hypothetical protein